MRVRFPLAAPFDMTEIERQLKNIIKWTILETRCACSKAEFGDEESDDWSLNYGEIVDKVLERIKNDAKTSST